MTRTASNLEQQFHVELIQGGQKTANDVVNEYTGYYLKVVKFRQ